MENELKYIRGALKEHSIRVVPAGEEFSLSSGRKSRVYCDLKKTAMRLEYQQALSRLLVVASEPLAPTAYAGVALGGCHLASMAALTKSLDTIYVRKEAKTHGTKKLIEAPEMDKRIARVVLLEDVTTTAGSALKALQVLREDGYNVVGIVTVVDRRDAWSNTPIEITIEGVPIQSIYRIEELVEGNPDASL